MKLDKFLNNAVYLIMFNLGGNIHQCRRSALCLSSLYKIIISLKINLLETNKLLLLCVSSHVLAPFSVQTTLMCIYFDFMDIMILTFSLPAVVIKRVVPTLELLYKAGLWPFVNL